MAKIRVMIVEDMEPIRRRYKRLLSGDAEIEVVCDTDNGADAVLLAHTLRPDVILMDIEMESKEAGIDATRQILRDAPETVILILTVYDSDELLFSAVQSGAKDYLLKSAPPEEVVKTVKSAFRGEPTLKPVTAEKLRDELKRVREYEGSLLYTLNLVTSLTNAEMDLIQDLHQGLSRKEICEKRFIELTTVRTHVHNILRKFGAKDMAQVLDKMDQLGIFPIMDRYVSHSGV